jgi:hypothetical protein
VLVLLKNFYYLGIPLNVLEHGKSFQCIYNLCTNIQFCNEKTTIISMFFLRLCFLKTWKSNYCARSYLSIIRFQNYHYYKFKNSHYGACTLKMYSQILYHFHCKLSNTNMKHRAGHCVLIL